MARRFSGGTSLAAVEGTGPTRDTDPVRRGAVGGLRSGLHCNDSDGEL